MTARTEDEQAEAIAEAGGDVAEALHRLYEVCDGDEDRVGEALYSIDKAVRHTRAVEATTKEEG